jgi:hypothetical protein
VHPKTSAIIYTTTGVQGAKIGFLLVIIYSASASSTLRGAFDSSQVLESGHAPRSHSHACLATHPGATTGGALRIVGLAC